jgi:hypothetical protein
MRKTTINPQRGTSATPASAAGPEGADAADRTSTSDLNNQLYRAYLSGDGAAVERIMARLETATR